VETRTVIGDQFICFIRTLSSTIPFSTLQRGGPGSSVGIATDYGLDGLGIGYIPAEWLLRPDYYLWPLKRHRAVLWIIAHMVIYRTKQDRSLTMNDYLDFMWRAKWKFDNQPNRNRLVGTYLSILEL
jgi:hypothetical protein